VTYVQIGDDVTGEEEDHLTLRREASEERPLNLTT
jgi:hypothetical protein